MGAGRAPLAAVLSGDRGDRARGGPRRGVRSSKDGNVQEKLRVGRVVGARNDVLVAPFAGELESADPAPFSHLGDEKATARHARHPVAIAVQVDHRIVGGMAIALGEQAAPSEIDARPRLRFCHSLEPTGGVGPIDLPVSA